jgi:NADPH:quinone reductase-like Zn-dependent oxidoreductase
MHIAIQAKQKGLVKDVEVVESQDKELKATAGKVAVKHLVSGVAFAEGLIVKGLYPKSFGYPVTLGYDLVARVVDAPEGSPFSVGDVVAAMPCVGSWQTSSLLDTTHLVKVPDNVNPVDAVACVLNYVTAYQMMTRVIPLKDGDAVLVHAAAGGVGQALLDLLRAACPDVKVFGTASGPKRALVEDFGATFIDYKQDDFVSIVKKHVPEGIVIAFDAIGYDNMKKSVECLSKTKPSALVIYGITNDAMNDNKSAFFKIGLNLIAWSKLKFWDSRDVTFYSIADRRDAKPGEFKQDLTLILDLLSQGKLKPTIQAIVPMRLARDALVFLQAGKSKGKLVLVVDSELEEEYKRQGKLIEQLE